MDVRCSRCGTEYDFDDALVSERGTTVKCTNCGHQFKVFPGGGGGAPERWIVRKSSGRELVYTSLRDLQRAIAQRQVGPADLLSRGGGHPLRALGAIAELEPFFQAQGPAVQANEAAQRTLLGTGSEPAGQNAALEQPTRVDTRSGAGATPAGGFVPPRRGAPLAPPRSPPPTGSDPFAAQELDPATEPRNVAPLIPTEPPIAPDEGPQIDDAPLQNDGITASFRSYQDSFSDQSFPNVPVGGRRPALKWVVGIVIVGGLAFVGGTIGMKYARKLSSSPAASAQQTTDPRVGKLVEEGEALLQKGDLESAKEALDKASALADKDPAALSLLARIEATRADAHWLALKLIDPSHQSELDAERAELATRLPKVQKTADAAASVAPNEPSGIRARVDALRLAGNVAKAREQVGSLGEASQPETAYVLAALDLAEASPNWATVVDRLRTAAAAERGSGRARAALVYALASSGAMDEASAELSKLDAAGPESALVARLRAFVQRRAGAAPPASGVATATSPPTVLAGSVQPRPAGASGTEPTGTEVPPKGDFRRLLEDASSAKKSGDLGRAESLYRAAKDQQPGNVEALAGLGDVARMRGDSATAMGYYDSVLHQNPTYLPALIASADLKWAAGDRVGALFLYKRVVNQTDPGTPYGQRAAARIAEAQGSGTSGAAPPSEPAPEKKPASEPPPKPPSDTPNIDTSDLPGFK
jgi:predicted Zn finger-like uncharacterized protein